MLFDGRKTKMMERIEQLEWLICKGKHSWNETGYAVIGSVKNPQEVVTLVCKTCAKKGMRAIESEGEDTVGPIGFKA